MYRLLYAIELLAVVGVARLVGVAVTAVVLPFAVSESVFARAASVSAAIGSVCIAFWSVAWAVLQSGWAPFQIFVFGLACVLVAHGAVRGRALGAYTRRTRQQRVSIGPPA